MGHESKPGGRESDPKPQSGTGNPGLIKTALARHQAGDATAAETLYRQVIAQDPSHADALHSLGALRHQSGNSEEAVEYISKAISLKPGQADYHAALGSALLACGQPNEARESLLQAVRLDPSDFEALFQLGVLLKSLQNLEGAAEALQGALRLRPGDIKAQMILGATYYEMNDIGNSEEIFQKVLQTNPGLAEVHFGLGSVLWLKKDHAGAEGHLRQAIRLKPGLLNVYFYLGAVFADAGKIDEENTVYKEALALWPDNAALGLLSDIHLPPISQSSEEIDERRKKLEGALKGYNPDSIDIPPKDLPTIGRPLSFFLAFQGRDDLGLKSRYADLFSRSLKSKYPGMFPPIPSSRASRTSRAARPAGDAPPRQGVTPRIGIVATQAGPFLLWIKGLINHLTPGRFRTTIICTPECRAGIEGHFDEAIELDYLIIDRNFEQVVHHIRAREFDLLFFHEVGTDPVNYFLPFFRLAPVQCTSFAAGYTTGIPEMDYFVSSDLIEPEGAERHYRERLVRLESLGFYFYPPPRPEATKDRAHFGLSDSDHIYACPQALFKIHPDIDRIFGEILRHDERALLLLVESRVPERNEMLMRRFRESFPGEVNRVRMLPRQSKADFMSLLTLSDVLLDPVHCGGGTTTFESLATGTPLVTWPGEFARGRFTHACYRKMEVMDCVASSLEDYAELAIALGNDSALRDSVKEKILAANHAIYEDMESVREVESFFAKAAGERE